MFDKKPSELEIKMAVAVVDELEALIASELFAKLNARDPPGDISPAAKNLLHLLYETRGQPLYLGITQMRNTIMGYIKKRRGFNIKSHKVWVELRDAYVAAATSVKELDTAIRTQFDSTKTDLYRDDIRRIPLKKTIQSKSYNMGLIPLIDSSMGAKMLVSIEDTTDNAREARARIKTFSDATMATFFHTDKIATKCVPDAAIDLAKDVHTTAVKVFRDAVCGIHETIAAAVPVGTRRYLTAANYERLRVSNVALIEIGTLLTTIIATMTPEDMRAGLKRLKGLSKKDNIVLRTRKTAKEDMLWAGGHTAAITCKTLLGVAVAIVFLIIITRVCLHLRGDNKPPAPIVDIAIKTHESDAGIPSLYSRYAHDDLRGEHTFTTTPAGTSYVSW